MLIKRKTIEAQANCRSGPGKRGQVPVDPDLPRKAKFAPVTLSEMDGVRYLHFGTEWVQGAMRLRKPDWLELEYAQQMMAWMLFLEKPRHIVQLGLGTAALTKFCYKQFPDAYVTAIELNPSVIQICNTMFKLPPNDARLHVREMDAMDFVLALENHGAADILQVDLYDATARGPVLDTPAFYAACAACLTADGVMAVNLFGDHPSYIKNLSAMRPAFAEIICLPEVHDGNVIALAFRQLQTTDSSSLHARAASVRAQTKLPTQAWVDGVNIWRERTA
ncbi:MAG: spermidine synthase [Burkholderiaceae bacterium]